MEGNILAKFKKNEKGDYVVISRTTSDRGISNIDIRNFFTTDDGEILPTKKGISINSELICDVLKGIIENLSSEELDDFDTVVMPLIKTFDSYNATDNEIEVDKE